MMKRPVKLFIFLIILTLCAGFIDLPEKFTVSIPFNGKVIKKEINPPTINISIGSLKIKKSFVTHLGLDLAGGTHIVLEADMKGIPEGSRMGALESARQVIERRVNFFGVSEPLVQHVKSGDAYRIIVELPGVTDVEEALSLIGQTAKLEFREFTASAESTQAAFLLPTIDTTKPVELTGSDLKKATLSFNGNNGEPEVAIEFTSDGGKKFAEITKRLIGKPLAIFLDGTPLMWPRVSTEITDGTGVISGGFTTDQAKRLALQLNAGALPVSIAVVEKRIVGASLGAESVSKSVQAGLIGLGIVAVFMVLKYGWLGFYADLALFVYGLLTLALYRIIPITLTLPGIAGFILSIGMAVDSNILIFERFREEVRKGKPWQIAMELGFGKAWDSIRDANFTTIITSVILFNPGNWDFLPNSGLVRGFAATLFLGVIISLFTGIIVTRTIIRVLYRGPKGGQV
jgi:preprotein translocase subunit SecD